MTQIAPMLAVMETQLWNSTRTLWVRSCFGNSERKRLSPGLSIGGAKFFLAHEAPEYGTRGPVVFRLYHRSRRTVSR